MFAALYGNPSIYMVALVVAVSATARHLGYRALLMGPLAWTAVVMFIVSTFLMNAWREFEPQGIQVQIFVWQHGLALDALIYFAILWYLGGREYVINIVLAIGVCYFLMRFVGEVEQIGAVGQQIVIAALAFACFRKVPIGNIIAILQWGILMVGEVAAAINTADCQFGHGMFGVRRAGSACEQVYGIDVGLWTAGICGLFMVLLLLRWHWPRRG